MAYKYVNPGYGELLDRAGTTVNDTKINAANGVAFFNNSNDRSPFRSHLPTCGSSSL